MFTLSPIPLVSIYVERMVHSPIVPPQKESSLGLVTSLRATMLGNSLAAAFSPLTIR